MQSTNQDPLFPSVYSPRPAASPAAHERKGVDSSFVMTCCLSAVTVMLGFAALIYQFAPEFEQIKTHNNQGKILETSFYG